MNHLDALSSELVLELAHAGIDVQLLRTQCRELILCGSRAQKRQTATSDWDLVAIGEGVPRRKRTKIDLIPIDSELLASPRWLESELAWHVKSFGVWLLGQPGAWLQSVKVTAQTLDAKIERIRYRLRLIERSWPHLSTTARQRYLRLLRRDLQRYHRLKDGRDVPSSPVLDEEWRTANEQTSHQVQIIELVKPLPAGVGSLVLECLNNSEVID